MQPNSEHLSCIFHEFNLFPRRGWKCLFSFDTKINDNGCDLSVNFIFFSLHQESWVTDFILHRKVMRWNEIVLFSSLFDQVNRVVCFILLSSNAGCCNYSCHLGPLKVLSLPPASWNTFSIVVQDQFFLLKLEPPNKLTFFSFLTPNFSRLQAAFSFLLIPPISHSCLWHSAVISRHIHCLRPFRWSKTKGFSKGVSKKQIPPFRVSKIK